ncbi:MAG: hypothetical protein ACLT0U_05035 [Coprococcus sp.]
MSKIIHKKECCGDAQNFLFEGRQRTVHVTQTGHMPAVLVLSGGKECICSSITVYALDGMFYAYK